MPGVQRDWGSPGVSDTRLRQLERAAAQGDQEAMHRLSVERTRAGLPADRPHAILRLTEWVGSHPRQAIMRVDNPIRNYSWAGYEHPVQELCCCSRWTRGEHQNHDTEHRANCTRLGYYPAEYGPITTRKER